MVTGQGAEDSILSSPEESIPDPEDSPLLLPSDNVPEDSPILLPCEDVPPPFDESETQIPTQVRPSIVEYIVGSVRVITLT